MLDPEFRSMLAKYDVILMQETHLSPEDEEALVKLKGYVFLVQSRQTAEAWEKQHGGVCAFVRKGISVSKSLMSSPDILVLDLERLWIINAYILPEGSRFSHFTEVAPEEKLLETVRLCGLVDSTKKIVIATDANARTASESAMLDHPQRVSKDLIKNARGNRLLSLCKESNLVIINGTDLEMPQQGSFTSHQHNGSAVVDYFIVSAGILMTVRQMTVEDIALDPDLRWSDHSQLLLVLSGSAVTRTAIQQEQSVPLIIPESVIDKEADLRYKETLDSAQPPRERLEHFYGPAYYTREPLSVYTDGACSNNGKKEAVAGAGICYGIRSPRNLSLRVPGPGQITNNRAEVFAVLQVLMRESPDRPLLVYTDSQYVIKECCYWAARHLTTGWNIPNGDLLKDVCHLLKLRPASTRFIWVKGHNGTAQNEKADELAKVGLQKDKINDYCSITGPPWMVTLTEYVTEVKERVKVSTDLPENSEIKQTDEKEKGHIKIISHRGRSRVASIQEYNLEKLRKCKTNAQFWMLYKNWLDPKARDFELSLQQLHAEFKARMNESLVPSVQLNHQHLSYVKHLNAMLSEDNVDETEEGFFSRDIEEDDVAEAKEHIWEKNLNSAKGSDQVDFKEILNIPNDKIADFLNWCIRHKRAPSRWLIAVIIGILKQGKNANDPQGYRLIVLECCFAKLLAYIIDRRIRAYAETKNLLPWSQNGFRPGLRTTNNPFIVKTLIDKARAQKKPLYIAFMDWTNAFPSTDRPTMWTKLFSMGVKGPMIDWLRMLYTKMSYVVKVMGSHSDPFESGIGVITGNPSSPMLFDLSVSDMKVTPKPGDIKLDGVCVNHVSHADDTGLAATKAQSMQGHIGEFGDYSAKMGFECSILKSVVMVCNGDPEPEYVFMLHGGPLKKVTEAKYIGVYHQSGRGSRYRNHYEAFAEKAKKAAGAILHARTFVGKDMPLWDLRMLYAGRVEPYLSNGAELIPDNVASHRKLLEDVQHYFLRRMLSIQNRSSLEILFTETGIIPIKYRRIILLLKNMKYLVGLSHECLAWKALKEAFTLTEEGYNSLFMETMQVLESLPSPVIWNVPEFEKLNGAYFDALVEKVEKSMHNSIQQALMSSPRTSDSLKGRLEYDKKQRK
ncbi:hypothetical protein D9757_014693 [Collybiopsis confluens]|uniref:RNase H type-1 domain-containing protein n=1 Tax=Collybiopsis confluens TaxID=2823264 RepID=A0A8H5CBM9_9AGAR|nr:hypothetical protein D9757_014693 [Collybiopsis confluens]